MNSRGFGRKRLWICLEWRWSTTKNLTQDGRCPVRDSNRAPLKCKRRALPLHQSARWRVMAGMGKFILKHLFLTIQVKRRLFLCSINYTPRKKMHERVSYSFTLRSLYPWRKTTGTHWIEGWASSRAGRRVVKSEKSPLLPDGIRTPARSPVTILTELPQPHFWIVSAFLWNCPILRNSICTRVRSNTPVSSLLMKWRGNFF